MFKRYKLIKASMKDIALRSNYKDLPEICYPSASILDDPSICSVLEFAKSFPNVVE
jgi:hypothetical protein